MVDRGWIEESEGYLKAMVGIASLVAEMRQDLIKNEQLKGAGGDVVRRAAGDLETCAQQLEGACEALAQFNVKLAALGVTDVTY